MCIHHISSKFHVIIFAGMYFFLGSHRAMLNEDFSMRGLPQNGDNQVYLH